MPKYFVMPEDMDKTGGIIHIGGENADHLITVMRSRSGDPVIVCDGQSMDYNCEISDIGLGRDKRVTLKILSEQDVKEPRLKVTLYQALPKADKMDYVIQKCVEMGVNEIIPIYTDNSDIKELSDTKLNRFRKISEASAKQTMRGVIPHIGPPIKIKQAIRECAGCGLIFAPYENERRISLKDILSENNMDEIKNAAFFIGSEGGFSDGEAGMFMEAGIPRVSLGARILRTETAGFAVLTILMYACNELGVLHAG